MKLTETNIREKNFHNKLQSEKKGRFENVFYKAINNMNEDFNILIKKNAQGSIILDYGCGTGIFSERISNSNPKKIFGIDISEISIDKAKKRAQEFKFNAEFKVDNCEKTSFSNNTFDIVFGSGIIHHLVTEKSLNEIDRILKPNGKFIFMEPLGTNPIINFYRKITPKSRSHDEHPLINKDLIYIEKKFKDMKIKYYGLMTLVFFPFYNQPQKSKFFKFLSSLDQFLFKFKFFRIFAWSVLITAKKI